MADTIKVRARPLDGGASLALRDRKGGDLAELPADLRVREVPRGA